MKKRRGPFIFLSYAREDKESVDDLYRQLVYSGLNPWMDDPPMPYQREGILPGADWESTIRARLKQAGLFFACFSKQSIQKIGYVQREYKLAVDRLNELPPDHVFLVAVLLEECSPREIRIDTQTLNSRHWYRLYRDGIRGLIHLGEKVASGTAVATFPDPESAGSHLLTEEGLQPLGDSLDLVNKRFGETLNSVLDSMRDLVPRFVEWKQRLDALPGPNRKRSAKPVFREVAAGMESFHRYMSVRSIELEQLFDAMKKDYSEAMAVASDAEFVTEATFEEKIERIRAQRGAFEEAQEVAVGLRQAFLSWTRGPSYFNRARRLGAEACGRFGELMGTLQHKTVELEDAIRQAGKYL